MQKVIHGSIGFHFGHWHRLQISKERNLALCCQILCILKMTLYNSYHIKCIHKCEILNISELGWHGVTMIPIRVNSLSPILNLLLITAAHYFLAESYWSRCCICHFNHALNTSVSHPLKKTLYSLRLYTLEQLFSSLSQSLPMNSSFIDIYLDFMHYFI